MAQPPEREHLLDLVLTNVQDATAIVSPAIADHKLVTAELAFKVPDKTTTKRLVCEFAKVDWDKMRDMLSTHRWEDMQAMHANEVATFFSKAIQI